MTGADAGTAVVVVGAGLAGVRVVEHLRALGDARPVTLVGQEHDAPYDRPPLSKDVLRGERDVVPLRERWDDLDIDLQSGRRAVAVQAGRRAVLLDDGRELGYAALVIASGATPRLLPGVNGAGVHVLRTLADAHALRADLRRCGRLVIVGGGFLGCEAAASAIALGAQVDLVEALPAPLARVLGARVGQFVAQAHEAAGVRLHCGTTVLEARGEGDGRALLLADGTVLPAPVVLLALGVRADLDWLAGSGIEVDDGVVCDARGRTSLPGAWAAGDAARWQHPLYREHLRVEHWTSAAGQAETVATDLAGLDPAPYAEVPYVWSDQYGQRLQLLGRPHPDDDISVQRVGPRQRLLAVYSRAGRGTGVLGLSAARWVMRCRPLLAARASSAELLAAATAGSR